MCRLPGLAGPAAIHENGVHRHNVAIVRRNLEARSKGEVLLKPIDIDYLYHSLNRRSDVPKLNDYSRLDPSMRELLVYGAPVAQEGGLFVANMTVNAPKGKKLLLMEKFNDFTKEMDYTTAGDGKLSVTLKERRTYNYVYWIWGWLNMSDRNEFIMITNHKGCGPENERTCHPVIDRRTEESKALAKWSSQQQGIPSASFGNQIDAGMVKESGAPILQETGVSVPTMSPIATLGAISKNNLAAPTIVTTTAVPNPRHSQHRPPELVKHLLHQWTRIRWIQQMLARHSLAKRYLDKPSLSRPLLVIPPLASPSLAPLQATSLLTQAQSIAQLQAPLVAQGYALQPQAPAYPPSAAPGAPLGGYLGSFNFKEIGDRAI
ncbi:hypothetical protein HOY80DRAFT_1046947 [Tuber brumale]|nr:hypothetical protein HOY80DRAFT_1046947 [Tuber brumale]